MGRRTKQPAATDLAVGYVRCSTEDQADHGTSLETQRRAIEAEAERRGWTLVAIYEDAGVSGKALKGRSGLAQAIAAIEAGEAHTLIVQKLDRLSRSLADFANVMGRFHDAGWNLVAMDLGIDLGTPSGEFMANVLASAAQWERRIIGQRTRDALAIKRDQGVVLGRPRVLPQNVRDRIMKARSQGLGWSAIARMLNDEGVPTARGGAVWHPSAVRAVVLSERTGGGSGGVADD